MAIAIDQWQFQNVKYDKSHFFYDNKNKVISISMMPKKPFINSLTSNILDENNKLKTELIEVRKHFKQFQNKMLNELETASKTIKFETKLLDFEEPEQALDQFVRLIQQSLRGVQSYKAQFRDKEEQTKKLKKQIQRKQSDMIQQQKIIGSLEELLTGQKQKCKHKSMMIQQLNLKYQKQIEKSAHQRGQFKMDIDNLKHDLTLKHKIEKKEEIEKVSRQLIEYRYSVEKQFTKNEKELRIQIQNKDRELKTLLATINTMVNTEKNNKRETASNNAKLHNRGMYQEQIQILEGVIQPFKDYSLLNDKIAELRKQLSKVKEENRNIMTQMVESQIQKEDVRKEIQIFKSKIELQKKKYEELESQFEAIAIQNSKCKEDIAAVENYYEKKWKDEFKSVKMNLEKKYKDKRNQLEADYQQKQKILEFEKNVSKNSVYEMKMAKEQAERRAAYLDSQFIELQKKHTQLQNDHANALRFHRENSMMATQDIESSKYQYKKQLLYCESRINSCELSMGSLKRELKISRADFGQKVKTMEKQHQISVHNLIKERDERETRKINEKNGEIEELKQKVIEKQRQLERLDKYKQEELKLIIDQLQKQKEDAIKQVKIQYYQEITKQMNKLQNNHQQIDHLNAIIQQEKNNYTIQLNRLQTIIKEKQLIIKQLKIQIGLFSEEKLAIKQATQLKEGKYNQIVHQKQSVEVLFSSQLQQIKDLERQIMELSLEKKKWKDDVTAVKDLFQKEFKEIKESCEKKVKGCEDRITELENLLNSGLVGPKYLQKMQELTTMNLILEDQIKKKEVQKLELIQDKNYYEQRFSESEKRLALNYDLRLTHDHQQPVSTIRFKANSKRSRIRHFKTQENYPTFDSKRDTYSFKRDTQIEKHYSLSKAKVAVTVGNHQNSTNITSDFTKKKNRLKYNQTYSTSFYKQRAIRTQHESPQHVRMSSSIV